MNKVKEFFKKHLAIILLIDAVVIAGLNLLIYPTFIKKDMNLIEVPVATVAIPSGTQVTPEMLSDALVNPESLPSNVETNKDNIIGMYVKEDYTIDEAMFISKSSLTKEKERMGDIFYKLNENEYAFTIRVSGLSNADSKFKVGQYIDLMYQEKIVTSEADDKDTTMNKVLIGILDNNVRVVYVSKGEDSTVITVAVQSEDLQYYITAKETGDITPILSSYSTTPEHTSDMYDESMTRQYLSSMSVTYNLTSEPEAVVSEAEETTEE